MKFLFLGGSGNLSSVAVLELLKKGHTVHCITRGNNHSIELRLCKYGAKFVHLANFDQIDGLSGIELCKQYDFAIDFISFSSRDVSAHVDLIGDRIKLLYIYISTTAFYSRSFENQRPLHEDSIKISKSWDYAINKYRAEVGLKEISIGKSFKTLVIRLGHTIGASLPVYLGNPGRAFIDHITSGKQIPFVGDVDHAWSVGSAFGLAQMLKQLPEVVDELTDHYICHYSEYQTSWRELYALIYSFFDIGYPVFKYLKQDDIALLTPEWLPSVRHHKIYEDLYDLTKLSKYFQIEAGKSLKDVVEYACTCTIKSEKERAYDANLHRLELLSFV